MSRRLLSYSVALALAAIVLSAAGPKPDVSKLPPASPQPADFVRDIQPILQARCLDCHGANKQKAGLRLDNGQALRGGDNGTVIVPGKSTESRLIHVVAGLDQDVRMPPKGAPLTAVEIGRLRSWIDQGAVWPKNLELSRSTHWSFQPIRRPAPPKVKNERWVRNDIDRFILAPLEAEGIAPSPEAGKATLRRRLGLDLTGLPPSPREVDEFLGDDNAAAYDHLVDHLLEAPAFGENWARHWLDLARYADSDGYEKDLDRPNAWRWREWVIDAINRDLPFDQFTIEQLAGDLLSKPTQEQRIATGFNRNTLLNREGGIDIEEDRVKAVVDRTATMGAVWLGLTVGCAECHSHKYDPLSQREFYQLYAFFNSSAERDIFAPLSSEAEQTGRRRAEFEAARKKYLEAARDADFTAWTKKVAGLPEIWSPLASYDLPTFTASNGANLFPQEDGSFLVTGTVENQTYYIVMGDTPMRKITGIRVEALTDVVLPKLGPGWDRRGNFVLSEVRVEASPLADVTKLRKYPFAKAKADYSQDGFDIARAVDGDEKTGWAIDRPELPVAGVERCGVFLFAEPIEFAGGTRMKIVLVQHHAPHLSLGRFRVTLTSAPAAQVLEQVVPRHIRRLAGAVRSPEQEAAFLRYYHSTFKPEHTGFRDYSEALNQWLDTLGATRAQVLVERSAPRPTHIHIRGDFQRKGVAVDPATPAVLPPLRVAAGQRRPTRLDLARWLVDPANPLTARVEVNRIWYHLFGAGLVASLADFGAQGDQPTHPELLDWLASEFVRLKWSRKKLIKLIVSSAAYRQASKHRADLAHRDVRNRRLARQNRFRLSAELVRDQYLSISGLLNPEIGGASLPVTSKRRGLYVQFKRTTPDYMLATFDAPAATVTCPLRMRSNSPLQSLTLMNDPLFVDCARNLARRVMKDAPEHDAWLRQAFRLATCRLPDDAELKTLQDLFTRAAKIYEEDDAKAGELVGKDFPLDVARAEVAALVVVCRVLLNLDEVIMRE